MSEQQTSGQRSPNLYTEEDMERVAQVLNQSIYAPDREAFNVQRLLGWLGLLAAAMALGAWLVVTYLI